MGYWKNRQDELATAGFEYHGGEEVCGRCVTDKRLAARLDAAATPGSCDFCEGTGVHTLPVDELFTMMAASIQLEYEPASTSDQLPTSSDWDAGDPTLDGAALLYELGDPLGEGRLAEVFADAFEPVVALEYWAGSVDKRLLWAWQDFAEALRTRTRFVFWRTLRSGAGSSAEIEPADMLDVLEEVIRDADLILRYPKGQPCFRARKHHPDSVLVTPEQLGPPPASFAVSSRMSPPGISMFYGATTEATALAELRGVAGEVATVSTWITARDCFVVDFDRLPKVPSIFCEERAAQRPQLRFVHRFVEEITQPLLAHDNPAVDYVPTQVVAEFIRHCVKTDLGEPIEAVRFPSAMHEPGSNSAFFVGPDDLAGPDPLLTMVGPTKRVVADSMSTSWIETVAPGG